MKFYTTRQYKPFGDEEALLVERDGKIYPFLILQDPKILVRNIIEMFSTGFDLLNDPDLTQLPADAQRVDMS